MKTIKEKVNDLPEKGRERFSDEIIQVCHSRSWCKIHGIEYSNPNIEKVKEILYREMFEGDTSYYNS